MIRARHMASALSLCAFGAVVASCGSTPSKGPTDGATSIAIPTPSAQMPGATSVPTLADWPEQDTPFAQAPSQMQLAWAAYGVTLIPSRHVFDNMPAVPSVVNKTNGALTQAQVQQTGLAFYRSEALWGWAAANDQTKLQLYIGNEGFLNTPAGDAESKGEPVREPACDLYPTKLAVVPVDASIKSFLEHLGYTVSSAFALVENYKTPCSVTALTSTGEKMVQQWAFGLNLGLEAGSEREDPVLGLVYVGEAARDCPESGYPTPPPGFTFPPGALGPSPGAADGGPLACGVFGG